jgi:putative methyltransferase (TIGR04325 family)
MAIFHSIVGTKPVRLFLILAYRYYLLRMLLESVAGFRKPMTMEEAQAVATKIGLGGHEEESNISLHLQKGERARLSDYPVMFWLQKNLGSIQRVLDLGGNVGNLYYCYEKYVAFPSDLVWTVYDLPRTVLAGRKLAHERGAEKLRFIDQMETLEECDLLLSSGSMHYLEPPLLDLLRSSHRLPRWVIINRAPLSKDHAFCTVQKDYHIAVACRIEKLNSVLSGMDDLGYALTDQWREPDRHVKLPLFPSHSVHGFSCFFFTRRH